MQRRESGELCESAKRGECCIDDICHGSDVTLCGFAEIRRDDSEEEDDGPWCSVCGCPLEFCQC
jgi:hypothetical protein